MDARTESVAIPTIRRPGPFTDMGPDSGMYRRFQAACSVGPEFGFYRP